MSPDFDFAIAAAARFVTLIGDFFGESFEVLPFESFGAVACVSFSGSFSFVGPVGVLDSPDSPAARAAARLSIRLWREAETCFFLDGGGFASAPASLVFAAFLVPCASSAPSAPADFALAALACFLARASARLCRKRSRLSA